MQAKNVYRDSWLTAKIEANSTTGITYVGYGLPGGGLNNLVLCRITDTVVGVVTTTDIEWASGDGKTFDKKWSLKATYTYSLT